MDDSRFDQKSWSWIDSDYCKGRNAHVTVNFNSTWNNMAGKKITEVKGGDTVRAGKSWTAALALLENRKEEE